MKKNICTLLAITLPHSLMVAGDQATQDYQGEAPINNPEAGIEASDAEVTEAEVEVTEANNGKAPRYDGKAPRYDGKAPRYDGKAPRYDPKAPRHAQAEDEVDPYDLYPDHFTMEPEWGLWKHMHLGARIPISPANPGIRRGR